MSWISKLDLELITVSASLYSKECLDLVWKKLSMTHRRLNSVSNDHLCTSTHSHDLVFATALYTLVIRNALYIKFSTTVSQSQAHTQAYTSI